MPFGTFYESDDDTLTPFSFVVFIKDEIWAVFADGTLPAAIPATVVEAPLAGAARPRYLVLKVGTQEVGPVGIVDFGAGGDIAIDAVIVQERDEITLQILSRSA
jgi:hypothetical protein